MEEIATGSVVATTADADPSAEAPTCARAPIGLLAELTHRCPLQCPYCSNPIELTRVKDELTTAQWQDVMRQAGEIGVLQLHLSGGEPCVRQDLEKILESAVEAGLYTNLITSGVTLTRERLEDQAQFMAVLDARYPQRRARLMRDWVAAEKIRALGATADRS